jgi:hypothetical protein
MLLPSALTCETTSSSATTTAATRTRYQSALLFASPPLSPPPTSSSSTHPAISNLYSTCRALQSMLAPSPPPTQLPSPPTTHSETVAALSSPFKLRLRARPSSAAAPRKISKRAPAAPPRGINKRRRALADDLSREAFDEEDEERTTIFTSTIDRPSTPKRMRVAPEVLPLGLDRADFQSLQRLSQRGGSAEPQTSETESESETKDSDDAETKGEGEDEWSTEEDRILVELVLEKLKLTRSDWQDCARSLGKDRGSVGRRWKSLMGAGDVGLKGGGGRARLRRGKIHSTWR